MAWAESTIADVDNDLQAMLVAGPLDSTGVAYGFEKGNENSGGWFRYHHGSSGWDSSTNPPSIADQPSSLIGGKCAAQFRPLIIDCNMIAI